MPSKVTVGSDVRSPNITLPKGGGAIRDIGEKFAANPVTGTGSMSVPVAVSPGRVGFGPQLSLSYDSLSGNGPFGFGWSLSLPSITRKTEKGLPQYRDADESDVFILSGTEDLVPVYRRDADGSWVASHPGYQRDPDGFWVRDQAGQLIVHEDEVDAYRVRRYRPRIEGLFARIERWTRIDMIGDVHWRSISKDNILTLYGGDADSRIADPLDPSHIFNWLICEMRDDKGQAVLYRYKAEDGLGVDRGKVNERNRGPQNDVRRTPNRYAKHIYYGNRTPLIDNTGYRPLFLDKAQIDKQIANAEWMFEVAFDYGEHDPADPKPDDESPWLYRPDPFSSYRACFEVRTTRICKRVLMFHHFPDEEGVGHDCLVHSTDFTYSDEVDPMDVRNPVYTFLLAVTQTGYRRSNTGYDKRSLPPLEFKYTQPIVQDTVEDVDTTSLENLPIGLDDGAYHWTDLHGEGVPGILTEQAGAWLYKRNLSPIPKRMPDGSEQVSARFGPVETVAAKPNVVLSSGAEFMDLGSDGQTDIVVLDGPAPGVYEHDDAEGWRQFRSFTSRLNRDIRDPNVRFVDLDGDGCSDVLITEDGAFVWHASLGTEGFGDARRVTQARDEEKGPRIVFADGTQSIYLADLSGDGLTDVVRIRNGEVCYWPNLGYGLFGAKVTMDNSPWFDNPDQFDQKRIRLADIDGTGSTDIIYLHRDGVRLYFNQSGNSWSQPHLLTVFPRIDDALSILATDLLGNGTACLVWSSPLPADALRMRYVNLIGTQKPHLLIQTTNNLGGETRIEYASSTKFYLLDKRAGKPWLTRLPFPVHVVESVATFDHVSRNRFVQRYAYHHGYFDAEEREFRGFGSVEQWDTEAFEDYVVGVQGVNGGQELSPELNQPPVTTRTWYHTGAFLGQDRILHQYRNEYYQQDQHVPDPVLPAGLTAAEMRECVRALKGAPLRQELYSFDGSPNEHHPYTVAENNFEIRWLQPRGVQRHGVFFPVGRESLSLNYERNPVDPRVSHSFGLELDAYGNTRLSCSVIYGRKVADALLPAEVTRDQQRQYITYAETDYTPDIEQGIPADVYRLRIPFESRKYEITGVSPAAALFRFDEIKASIAASAPIDYEVIADGLTPQKRLLSQVRALFLDNSLNPLPLGQCDSLGLGYQSFDLAFTPGVTTAHYAGNVSDAEFTAAGYVHFENDAIWWIPSGTPIYPADPVAHFYIPTGFKDSFGLETIATFDRYDLLTEQVEVKQAAWNVVTAVNDYRVLGPVLMTDPNKNRSAVEHDELGMVVKTAIMGKVGSADGDTLADPTTRMEYELFNWLNNRKPNYVHTFARENHGASNPRWQETYSHFNGSGGVVMIKAQAHPGKAFKVNPDGTKAEVDADPRWVGNGRAILNNKGKPVKQYEPYFSTTNEYEDEKVLREIGVTPVLYYDPVGRNIRTLLPNGVFTRVEVDPWKQTVFDANDTVKESQWYADRGRPDPAVDPEPLNDPERRAAWLAAKHADTPGVLHFDSLGRPIYTVSDYGGGTSAAMRSESDLTGRISKIFDQKQREVAGGFVSMSGTPVVSDSAEKGRRWTFQNVLGELVKTWDEHGRQFRIEYDALHRPVSAFVRDPAHAEIVFNYVVYGDRLANAEQLNLLGAAHQIFDQAGMVRAPELDFKGNPKSVDRVLAMDYKNPLDWGTLRSQADYVAIQAAANSALEIAEVFTATSQYDALNRPTQVTLPDGSVIVPTYNEANFLASLQCRIAGQGPFVEFLKDQDCDAKGQREFAHYGNEVFTRYFYDPFTFRLANLVTYQSGNDPQTQALQKLNYTFDPVGNVTQIRDDAQQTRYFSNAVVKPESLYEYDAVYQLIRASGRELAGLPNDDIRTNTDLDFIPQLPHVNNIDAVRNYTEEYEYDLLGNIKTLKHRFQTQPGVGSGWTRHYQYALDDAPIDRTNRLTATSMPGDPEAGPYSGVYEYDAYGNMTRMPHLAVMDWNFSDNLQRVDLGGGGTAYYVYDASGQRARKVIERNGNLTLEWIFLGALMIFRRRRNTKELRMERRTVHISDNAGIIAQVDLKTLDDDNSDPSNALNVPLVRYQYSNHLGSAVLETDDNGNPISYEEYQPYGTTAYRSAKPGFDLSLKRYRFSGKELDEETGLYYFGARYYAPWLGRWTSSDPAGFVSGLNLYRYCRNSPVVSTDPSGMDDRGNVYFKPNSPEAKLLSPAKEAEARAYLQGVYTSRLKDPSQEFVIDEMHFDKNKKYWSVDRWHVAPKAAQNDSSPGNDSAAAVDEASGVPSQTPSGSPASPGASDQPADKGSADKGSEDNAARPDSLTHAGPVVEKGIWLGRDFRDRGFTLEHLYNNDIVKAIKAQGDNRPLYDVEDTRVKQIKSSNGNSATLEAHASKATRDAGEAIRRNPTGTMTGKSPQAVVITPTDAPASAATDIRAGYDNIRRPVPNSVPPEHVRGLPGAVGAIGTGLTVAGTGLSAFALGGDLANEDYTMAGGDALSTAGGGLELYAIATPGATVAGVSAMSAGLAVGGIGIAVTSGISGVRSYQRGDYAGAVAGAVGVLAGIAITAGIIFSAPALLVGGLIAAAAVGLFHLGRWLFS